MTNEEAFKLIIDKASKSSWPYISYNGEGIKSIPANIGSLHKLQDLFLRNNKLINLPPEIQGLNNLETLSINHNNLTSLPPEIGNLSMLKDLSLSGNKISSLPTEIKKLNKLQSLNLSNNKLTTLQSQIFELTELEELILSDNKLSNIPPEIYKLSKLKVLNLKNNNLDALPPEISLIPNLISLQISKNPIKSIPPEIQELGTQSILSYLNNLYNEGSQKRNEAKLLILGDADEGKTCVSRALRGLPFSPQNTTHGVEVNPWTFNHPKLSPSNDNKITLNIWDFEGQEISHQSHQFFLTERSLYLLVFKGRSVFILRDIINCAYIKFMLVCFP